MKQQTKELLEGLELVLVQIKKIAKDGKVNLADLPAAMEVLNNISKVTAAIEGVEQVPAELKDITLAEAQELIAKLFAVVAAVKAA